MEVTIAIEEGIPLTCEEREELAKALMNMNRDATFFSGGTPPYVSIQFK